MKMYRAVFISQSSEKTYPEPAKVTRASWDDYFSYDAAALDVLDNVSRYVSSGWELFTRNMLVTGIGQTYRSIEFNIIEIEG